MSAEWHRPVREDQHGTQTGYSYGCRCEFCRQAYARWRKRYVHERNHNQVGMIDATGTRRRVQALIANGWPVETIARRTGTSYRALWTCLKAKTVTRAKAERIAAVYEQMSMAVPEQNTPDQRRKVTRAKRRAANNHWPVPLAWTDIDNPDAQPAMPADQRDTVDEVLIQRALNGIRVKANPAERAEIERRWMAAGRPLNELARTQGTNIWRDRRTA